MNSDEVNKDAANTEENNLSNANEYFGSVENNAIISSDNEVLFSETEKSPEKIDVSLQTETNLPEQGLSSVSHYAQSAIERGRTFVILQVEHDKCDDGATEREHIHFRLEADAHPQWLLNQEINKIFDQDESHAPRAVKTAPPSRSSHRRKQKFRRTRSLSPKIAKPILKVKSTAESSKKQDKLGNKGKQAESKNVAKKVTTGGAASKFKVGTKKGLSPVTKKNVIGKSSVKAKPGLKATAKPGLKATAKPGVKNTSNLNKVSKSTASKGASKLVGSKTISKTKQPAKATTPRSAGKSMIGAKKPLGKSLTGKQGPVKSLGLKTSSKSPVASKSLTKGAQVKNAPLASKSKLKPQLKNTTSKTNQSKVPVKNLKSPVNSKSKAVAKPGSSKAPSKQQLKSAPSKVPAKILPAKLPVNSKTLASKPNNKSKEPPKSNVRAQTTPHAKQVAITNAKQPLSKIPPGSSNLTDKNKNKSVVLTSKSEHQKSNTDTKQKGSNTTKSGTNATKSDNKNISSADKRLIKPEPPKKTIQTTVKPNVSNSNKEKGPPKPQQRKSTSVKVELERVKTKSSPQYKILLSEVEQIDNVAKQNAPLEGPDISEVNATDKQKEEVEIVDEGITSKADHISDDRNLTDNLEIVDEISTSKDEDISDNKNLLDNLEIVGDESTSKDDDISDNKNVLDNLEIVGNESTSKDDDISDNKNVLDNLEIVNEGSTSKDEDISDNKNLLDNLEIVGDESTSKDENISDNKNLLDNLEIRNESSTSKGGITSYTRNLTDNLEIVDEISTSKDEDISDNKNLLDNLEMRNEGSTSKGDSISDTRNSLDNLEIRDENLEEREKGKSRENSEAIASEQPEEILQDQNKKSKVKFEPTETSCSCDINEVTTTTSENKEVCESENKITIITEEIGGDEVACKNTTEVETKEMESELSENVVEIVSGPPQPHVCNKCGYMITEFVECEDKEELTPEDEEVLEEPKPHDTCAVCRVDVIKENPSPLECINCVGDLGRDTKFDIKFDVTTKSFVVTCKLCKDPLKFFQHERTTPKQAPHESRGQCSAAFSEMVKRWQPSLSPHSNETDSEFMARLMEYYVSSYTSDYAPPESQGPPVRPPPPRPFPVRPVFRGVTAYSLDYKPCPIKKPKLFHGRRRVSGLGYVKF